MSLTAFVLSLRENESLTINTTRDFIRYELSVGIGSKHQQRIVGSVDIEQAKSTHYDVLSLDTFGCLNNTIKVYAGHYVDLANPDPKTIDVKSIAAALSKICRFGGHCPMFYSVAEHCIHAMSLALKDKVKGKPLLAILLHDAAEAYIGDMVKPLKVTIPQYAEAEKRIERAIEQAFGIEFDEYSELIKRYDRAMLKVEKTTLWPEDKEEWAGFSQIPTANVDLQYWDPETARRMYLYMFYVASPL